MAGITGFKEVEAKQFEVYAGPASDVKIVAPGAKQNVNVSDEVKGNKDLSIGNILSGGKNNIREDGLFPEKSLEENFLDLYKSLAKLQSQLIDKLLKNSNISGKSGCNCCDNKDSGENNGNASSNPFDINGDGKLDKAELTAMLAYAAAKNSGGEKEGKGEKTIFNPFADKDFNPFGTGLGMV